MTTLRVLEDRMRALLGDVRRVVGRDRTAEFVEGCIPMDASTICKICGDDLTDSLMWRCAGCLAEVCEDCLACLDRDGDAWCVYCVEEGGD